jgi:hypothetical protein
LLFEIETTSNALSELTNDMSNVLILGMTSRPDGVLMNWRGGYWY